MSDQAVLETRFAAGLAKLCAACRQEADALTLETYAEAMADQVDPDEWDAFVHEALRARKYTWFPGLQKLGDDFDAWRAARTPKRALPLREGDQFWASGNQALHVAEVVRRNPKGVGEGPMEYVRRIAIQSGLMHPDPGERPSGRLHVTDPRTNREPTAVRMPFKDPEDTDDTIDRGDDPNAY